DIGQSSGSQEAFNLGEITKGGARQRIVVIERPGQLAGIERNRHFVLSRIVERLGKVKVLTALRIERAKEPKLVPFNWAPQIAAEIDLRKTIGRRAGEREVLHFAYQTLRGAITEDITVKLVGAALGDDVENTAG